jgi:lysophospholipase L1-like esterase
MKKVLVLSIIWVFLGFFTPAQAKKIYIIGSSTAEGTGASSYANSFAGRLAAYYNTHTFVNLALGGTTTYNGMPSTFVPPLGRPGPDLLRNITKAINDGADIIIVSFPTNDLVNDFTNTETLNNLRIMHQTAVANNRAIYFLGTQPRNTMTTAQKLQGIEQNNLILAEFPNSINVYPLLDAPDGLTIDPTIAAPDGIHVNDEGHRRIYQQIVDFNIFQDFLLLPVNFISLSSEAIAKTIKISWGTSSEHNNNYFNVERSSNGSNFTSIATIPGKGNSNIPTQYSYTDQAPILGKSYYRLAQVDIDNRKRYSKTLSVDYTESSRIKAYPVPALDILNISWTSDKKQSIRINVIDLKGAVISSLDRFSEAGNNVYSIPIAHLPRGQYVVNISSSSGNQRISFIRQ